MEKGQEAETLRSGARSCPGVTLKRRAISSRVSMSVAAAALRTRSSFPLLNRPSEAAVIFLSVSKRGCDAISAFKFADNTSLIPITGVLQFSSPAYGIDEIPSMGLKSLAMETIIDYLKRNLRDAGAARWEAIAAQAGVAKTLPRKIAYDDRDNPGVQTVQPLLDFFQAIERGERSLPELAEKA